jgi:hypothetical protein
MSGMYEFSGILTDFSFGFELPALRGSRPGPCAGGDVSTLPAAGGVHGHGV